MTKDGHSSSGPVFLVNPYSEPVLVRIQGRANYLNCSPLADFLKQMMNEGKRSFIIDFQQCTAMDSTFLGILAGTGLELLKFHPPGDLILSRLGARNLELVRNLGLHRIMGVDTGENAPLPEITGETLYVTKKSDLENARMILTAHENLVKVDAANQAKFQDVIAYLQSTVHHLPE